MYNYKQIDENNSLIIEKCLSVYVEIHKKLKSNSVKSIASLLQKKDERTLDKELRILFTNFAHMIISFSFKKIPIDIEQQNSIDLILKNDIFSQKIMRCINNSQLFKDKKDFEKVIDNSFSKGTNDFYNEASNIYLKCQLMNSQKGIKPNDLFDLYIVYFCYQYRDDYILISRDKKLLFILKTYNEKHKTIRYQSHLNL